MYCKKCGNLIEPGQKFCIKCGEPANEERNPPAPSLIKVKKRCPGAIFLAVSAAFSLIFLLISVISGATLSAGYIIHYLFSACATAYMATVLLMKRTDKLLFAAFVINAFASIIAIICLGFSIWYIFGFITNLVLAAFVALFTLNVGSLEPYRQKAEKLWYLPAVITGVYEIANLINLIASYAKNGIPFRYWAFSFIITLLTYALVAGAYLLICKWLVNPYKEVPAGIAEKAATAPVQSGAAASGYGYVDIVVHILLTIFVFPVYLYIWIYKTTAFTNTIPGAPQRDPVKKLLLCLFVPFYIFYWIYITAAAVDSFAKSKGINSDLTMPSILLSVFGLMFIAIILLQIKLNSAIQGAAAPSFAHAYAPPARQVSPVENADDLMKYKQLLDIGAITPEEYEIKKKQIMGIEK